MYNFSGKLPKYDFTSLLLAPKMSIVRFMNPRVFTGEVVHSHSNFN
jgi:hypothetical protein